MRRMVIALCPILLSLFAAARADQPVYYAIEMNEKPIGYAIVTSNPVELDGRKLLSVQSQTVLKIALLGAERLMVRRSQTTVDAATGLPVSFRLVTDTNGQIGHIECEFKDQTVSTWMYADGDPKGEPTVTELLENTCLLGSNNFGHWGVVLRRAIEQAQDGSAIVPVFLPDMKQKALFALKKAGVESIEILGQSRNCEKWSLQGEGLTVLADVDSRQLVRMDVTAQKTVIRLADEAVVQVLENAGPQEVMAQNFVQSNVAFDDMMKVVFTQAAIEVSVFGSGLANDVGILKTAMQQFDGEKDGAKIKGTVTVRSSSYQGEQAPAFPTLEPPADALAEWVRPSPMIESDDAEIAALAKQLTDGATTRWEAVQRSPPGSLKKSSTPLPTRPRRVRAEGPQGRLRSAFDPVGRHAASVEHPGEVGWRRPLYALVWRNLRSTCLGRSPYGPGRLGVVGSHHRRDRANECDAYQVVRRHGRRAAGFDSSDRL